MTETTDTIMATTLTSATVVDDALPRQIGEGWQICGAADLREYSLEDAAAAKATNDDPEFRLIVHKMFPDLRLIRPSWCADPGSPLGEHMP
jgi:hypothetical protein